MAFTQPASAQQAAEGTAVQLPPVVVQGATLQQPRPVKPAVGGDDEAPAPQPKPKPAPRKTTPATDSASTGTGSAPKPPQTVSDGTGGGAAFGEGAAAQGGDSAGGGSVGGQPLDRIGSAVSVVTGEQLRAQQIRSAGEALRSLPGVEVNKSGGLAGLTQVRIRGAEAHHTLVVIDGIVANSGTDGEFDFGDLMAEDIDRIEVIRGPQSALYGSGALGGVVNIVTRSGRGPMTMAGRVEGGANGTTDLAARVSGGTDYAWASATIHERKTSGFNIAPDAAMNENDGSKMTTIAANGGFRPFAGVELTFTARRTSKDIARDDQTGNGPGSNRNGLIVASDSVSRQDGHVTLLGAQARWDMFGGALTHILRANRNVTERNDIQIADFGFGGIFPSKFANTSEVDTLAYQSTYRFATPMFLSAKHAITGLVERESQDFTPNSDGADGAKHERGRMSFAGEWQGEFLNRLDLVAGVRHDDSDTLPDYTTWRTSASLRLPEIALRPHASVGTAVKLPSQFEQFGTAANFVSNSALRAEKSFGWDAGVEVTVIRDKAIVDITYFEANLTDKIAAQYASIFDANPAFACHAGDFFCSRSINLDGVSRRHGIETSGRFALLPGVSVGLAYTRLIAQDNLHLEEKRRPPNTARADLTYLFDNARGRISVAAVYNGEMKDTAFAWPNTNFTARTVTLDDYWLVNVAASYKVSPNVEVYGRVENALDSKYEENFGFNTAGIAGYAGVKFMLQAPVSTVASRE